MDKIMKHGGDTDEASHLLEVCIKKVREAKEKTFCFDVPRPHETKGDLLTVLEFTREETIEILEEMHCLLVNRHEEK